MKDNSNELIGDLDLYHELESPIQRDKVGGFRVTVLVRCEQGFKLPLAICSLINAKHTTLFFHQGPSLGLISGPRPTVAYQEGALA